MVEMSITTLHYTPKRKQNTRRLSECRASMFVLSLCFAFGWRMSWRMSWRMVERMA
jgi:hypothetical protein